MTSRKSSARGLSKGVSKGGLPGAPVLDDGTAAVFLQQKLARKEELVIGWPLVVWPIYWGTIRLVSNEKSEKMSPRLLPFSP